ncbi:MAG: magnesium-translocating P-type ATPase [Patescibacteria group bacterium]|jgi:Mg2+-importing ATPase
MDAINFNSKQTALLNRLYSSPNGLTADAVRRRQAKYGPNSVVTQTRRTLLISFLEKFTNPLIILLLFASFFSMLTGSMLDFVMILIMILISVSLDVYLEHRSEKAAERLKRQVEVKTDVMRNGMLTEIPSKEITVGDLISVESGSVIPADVKIISIKDLHIDESTLTGESFPQEKTMGQLAYMGTLVVNGEGFAVVETIGKDTRYGKIATDLANASPETNFERGIRQFGYLVMKIAICLVLVVFLINSFSGHQLIDSFLFALALAIGITPELLPMIMTVNLAEGALKMSRKGVIVKHLPSIHNLGSMNMLCTDKTGTLTENKIILEKYENFDFKTDRKVLQFAHANCTHQSNIRGPLEEAILKHHEVRDAWQKIDEIPFDFVRKRLSVVLKKDGKTILICKGALEEMLPELDFYEHDGVVKPLTTRSRQKISDRLSELSKDGFRVLAVSYRELKAKNQHATYSKTDEKDLIFLGLTAFQDPPKQSAKRSLKQLAASGIGLKILTGDNPEVTMKVCKDLDLAVSGVCIGDDLLHLSEEKLVEKIKANTIFAKLTPDQKKLVISTLQRSGMVVGYLGDGVNDASSLKQADVGISVENATDVAKESADLILMHKSLEVLLEGVKDGRKVFINTTKYIFMNFGSNFGNMISMSVASFFLPFIPMLPIQIILNNLIYDVSQLSLPTDNVDNSETAKPLKWDINQIKRFIFIFGPVSSIFDILTFVGLLYIFHSSVGSFRSGWFIESLATQAMVMIVLRTKIIPFFKSKPSIWVKVSASAIVMFAIIISQSPLGKMFEFNVLPIGFWLFMIVVLVLNVFVNEFAKHWFYSRESRLA